MNIHLVSIEQPVAEAICHGRSELNYHTQHRVFRDDWLAIHSRKPRNDIEAFEWTERSRHWAANSFATNRRRERFVEQLAERNGHAVALVQIDAINQGAGDDGADI